MTKKSKWKTVSLIVALTPLSIVLFWGYINGMKYKESVGKNSAITVGKIYDYEHVYKHAPVLKYEFEFEGKKYHSSSSASGVGFHWEDSYKRLFPKLNGGLFPVFFSKDNPGRYNKILVTPDDFNEVDINYPDSLHWVIGFLEN